jgi:hypothetical protein
VKDGAIIPVTDPHNHPFEIDKTRRAYEIYPAYRENSSFIEYDDDGVSEQYKAGRGATTLVESRIGEKGLVITVHPTRGDFDGLVKDKSTEFIINVMEKPGKVSARIGGARVKLVEARSLEEFRASENTFFYHAAPDLNRFATKGSDFEKEVIVKNPLLLVKLPATDVTVNGVTLSVDRLVVSLAGRRYVPSVPPEAPRNARVSEENAGAYTLTPSWERVANAEYYEIDFNDMRYSTIRDTFLLFDGLAPETTYTFKARAFNRDGHSGWTTFDATTKVNPLEFAIKGIVGEVSLPHQRSSGVENLFDFDESNLWHTRWDTTATAFDLVMDLNTINRLEKFHYLPRAGRSNGTLQRGIVYHSLDKETWTEAGAFEWRNREAVNIFTFVGNPAARYVKIHVTESLRGFGSGRELYVFKVPGTESLLPGDINNDRLIDENDLTSYRNYTGLRRGDADFEGYVSNGDVNDNGLIDAYDISVVATRLDGGAGRGEKVDGKIEIRAAKREYRAGEIVEIRVKGTALRAVNAFSFALPYNPLDYEFIGMQALNTREMENFTTDRTHANGVKTLYPTFVNVGDKPAVEGTLDLCILRFKAARDLTFDLKAIDGLLVDKRPSARPF